MSSYLLKTLLILMELDDDVLQELWSQASEMDAVPVRLDADVKIDEDVLIDIKENGEPEFLCYLSS